MLGAVLASATAEGAGPRPVFQMPFACGQTWEASTYSGHWPDEDSIDLGDWDASDANMSQGAPVLASAAGTVLEVGTDNDGSNVDGDPAKGNYVFLDHGGGWVTHYLHLEEVPPLTDGRLIAQGEYIGRVGNSGTTDMHLHYSQLEDGDAVRIAFNGTRIGTHAGNMSSWKTWGNGEKLTSVNCPANSFLEFEQSGLRYQLAYMPATGGAAIDRLKSDGKGVTTVWSDTWSKGWTHFTPFRVGGKPHYFAYKAATGEVDFDRIDIAPLGLVLGVTTVAERTFSKGWTHFMPFGLGSKPYFAAYNSLSGRTTFNRINSTGTGAETIWSGSWRAGWTHLVPFVLNGVQYFIAYHGSTGTVEIDRISGSGNSVSMTEMWSGTWTAAWSHLVPVSHKGAIHLLRYRATTGRAEFLKIRANGQGALLLGTASWTRSWTTFCPFVLSDVGHVMVYKTALGEAAVLKLNMSGSGISKIWTGSWSRGWA